MLVDEINIKLIIVGDGGVGKTSIVNAYLEKDIPESYIPTIGSNIAKKEYNIKTADFGLRINLWDLGGQRSFNPLNPSFFKNVDAAFSQQNVFSKGEWSNAVVPFCIICLLLCVINCDCCMSSVLLTLLIHVAWQSAATAAENQHRA